MIPVKNKFLRLVLDLSIFIVSVGFLSWWNAKVIVSDLHKMRDHDMGVYNQDVQNSIQREKDMQAILSGVREHSAQIADLIKDVNRLESQNKEILDRIDTKAESIENKIK